MFQFQNDKNEHYMSIKIKYINRIYYNIVIKIELSLHVYYWNEYRTNLTKEELF